ncbi:MAG: zinc ribbon domain-containing protein [Bacteroidales bacterium]|nr:zinc ribbon domain-containing protein [Bacteroidales bacterium]
MERVYKFCQSCGMPLSKDEAGGGTNADGSKSIKYCSHCFEKGQFTLPEITVQGMKDRVKEKMAELGYSPIVAWFFTLNIPKLERWKKM